MSVVAEATYTARAPLSQTTVWNPLSKQYIERDTLFLLDPDKDASLTVAKGRMVGAPYITDIWRMESTWDVDAKVQAVAGKYRKGIQTVDTSRTSGFLYMPFDQLPADEFTIEMWVKASVDWSTTSVTLFQVGYDPRERISISILGTSLQANFSHLESPAGAVNASITQSLAAHPALANEWVHLALTYNGTTLKFYRDGLLAASTNVVPPSRWAAVTNGALQVPGGGPDITSFVISDLRVSQKCRTPGQTITTSGHASLVVDPSTPTGDSVQKNLLGFLHSFPNSTTAEFAGENVTVCRTDKLLVATPIKAGGTDATHPTLGHSGDYSYDWQVVDRTLDYIVNTVGCIPYLSIDATPQILGGSVAPFSGTLLTTGRSFQSDFPSEHPSSNAEFAKIAGDLVYHVTVEEGHSVPYWGVWNEPDGSFWSGPDQATKRSTFMPFYAAVANAVKAINPSLKVGGPEVAGWWTDTAWFDDLIAYCGTNGVPLDFISWHFYASDVAEPGHVRGYIDRKCAAAGIPSPDLINGEWSIGAPLVLIPPWNQEPYFAGVVDISAAFYARSLIEMQRAGVVIAIVADPAGMAYSTDYGDLMSPTPHAWPALNVFRQWKMMNDTVVSHTLDGPPWLDAICSKSGSQVDVFLGCFKYRKETDQVVEISGLTSGQPVTVYVVDDQHSNYREAGPDHAELESYDAGEVEDGTVTITLRPRSSALVRVG